MPQRITGLFVALAGLVAVAGLALAGVSLRRAVRSGPQWKRRLVAAGLMLLASLGFWNLSRAAPTCYDVVMTDVGSDMKVEPEANAPATAESATPATGTSAAKASPEKLLAENPEWKALTATWREAAEVASGKRGPYPFDEKGKKALLDSLAKARADITRLRDGGLLSEAEATLLADNVTVLADEVNGFRPTEMRMATCYKPMSFEWDAARRREKVEAQIPMLRKLAASDRLRGDVVAKVLAAIDVELAKMTPPAEAVNVFSPEEKARMDAMRKELDPLVEKLRSQSGLPAAGDRKKDSPAP